jgi:hypothetical protein
VQISIQKHTRKKQRPTRSATGYSRFLLLTFDFTAALRPTCPVWSANGGKTDSTLAEIADGSACEIARPSFAMTLSSNPSRVSL